MFGKNFSFVSLGYRGLCVKNRRRFNASCSLHTLSRAWRAQFRFSARRLRRRSPLRMTSPRNLAERKQPTKSRNHMIVQKTSGSTMSHDAIKTPGRSLGSECPKESRKHMAVSKPSCPSAKEKASRKSASGLIGSKDGNEHGATASLAYFIL